MHIIGHIPPGINDCLQVWSRNYHRIINRFESTVSGQFFGHTHLDEFEIFYNENNNENKSANCRVIRPFAVAYIAPCLTSYGYINPGYRIYQIQGETNQSTYQVLDHETYFFNLTQANLNRNSKPIQYQLSYSAKSAYQLEQLTPFDWHHLVRRMVNDDSLLQLFRKYMYNQSNYHEIEKCQDKNCKNALICRLITSKSHDNFCKKFFKLTRRL